MRNRSSDLRIPRSDTLPLSHRDSTMSEVYYEVHMTRVLHTARISNVDSVMFIDRLREMVSFVLGKEIEKDAFRLVTSVGQRKKFWIPLTNRTSDLWIPRATLVTRRKTFSAFSLPSLKLTISLIPFINNLWNRVAFFLETKLRLIYQWNTQAQSKLQETDG